MKYKNANNANIYGMTFQTVLASKRLLGELIENILPYDKLKKLFHILETRFPPNLNHPEVICHT